MTEKDVPGQRVEHQPQVGKNQLTEPRAKVPIGAGRLAAQFLVDHVKNGGVAEIAGVVLNKEDLSNPSETDLPEDTQKRG